MNTADFLIIGGGAAGLSLAASLGQHASVILLEAEKQPGYHASGRSAAVFVPSYGHGALRDLTRISRAAFDEPDPAFFPQALLHQRGLLRLILAGGEAQHEQITSGVAGIEPLSVEQAMTHFPLAHSEHLVGASFEPDVHDIDADAFLAGCLRAAKHHGVQVVLGAAVQRLQLAGNDWTVQAGNNTYRAATIINAAGAWANNVGAMAGLLPLPLTPCRRSVAVLPMPGALTGHDNLPFVVTAPMRWYAKAQAGRLLVSPGDAEPVEPHDVFTDDMVVAEGMQRFEEDSGYPVTRVESTWAGLRTITTDEYPVIGFDPRTPRFFWLAGQCGFGIQCAPGIAALATRLLTNGAAGGASTETNLITRLAAHFCVERLLENEDITPANQGQSAL